MAAASADSAPHLDELLVLIRPWEVAGKHAVGVLVILRVGDGRTSLPLGPGSPSAILRR
jgi:hypothetical protein